MKKLKVLPPMRCDAGCGECCGVIPVTETEYRRVERFAREHGIVPVDHGAAGDKLTCPFYQGGTCAVYEVRPVICRVFGHAADLPCARGYNTNVDQRQIDRMLHANGRPTRLLHQMLPGFDVEAAGYAAGLLVRTGADTEVGPE